MKRIYKCMISAVMAVLPLMGMAGEQPELKIVPAPLHYEQGQGSFLLSSEETIVVSHDSLRSVADHLSALLKIPERLAPAVEVGTGGKILLSVDKTLPAEGYCLTVGKKGIELKGATCRGLFYGVETLRQLLSQADCAFAANSCRWKLPQLTIKDAPRFQYRGFMLDVSRHFMAKENVMKVIDAMSMLKMSDLHLHLTDDNGWRLEIKRYPKLTSVGAWRVDRGDKLFSERMNAQPGEKATLGGYYTQEEMREIIAYAKQKQINIIPEIDIPAHSNAALAAYPEYACNKVNHPITVIPGLGGYNSAVIFCAGKESTYQFIENIMDEVAALFPSPYIHLGGDEANKKYWKICDECQNQIKKNHLKDEEELQAYFMSRIAAYLKTKGKTVLGWDELTKAALPENAVIFGWTVNGKAALKAAEQGHKFVMTPARTLYLIRYQGPQWFEPMTYFGNNTLKDIYSYEPFDPKWPKEYKPLLWGVQASMWTEFCDTDSDVFYMVFPRLIALADVAWRSEDNSKQFPRFLKAMDAFLPLLQKKEINYSARSMFNIQHSAESVKGGKVALTLECERPDVVIRYTLDGTMPAADSPLYSEKLTIENPYELNAATFDKSGRRRGEILTLPFRFSLATGRSIANGNGKSTNLLNGLEASLRSSDFEWVGGSTAKKESFVIDLEREESIRSVELDCLNNFSMAVHRPRSVEVYLSKDNRRYTKFGEISYSDEEIFKEGNYKGRIRFEHRAAAARYIKVVSTPAGACPDGHCRPGQPAKYMYDEIIVE